MTRVKEKSRPHFTRVLALVVAGCAAIQSPLAEQDRSSLVDQLFSFYTADRYDDVSRALRQALSSTGSGQDVFDRTRSFLDRVEQRLEDWPVRAGAAFALEAAAAGAAVDLQGAAAVLGRASARLRRSEPPSAFELDWHIAAVAVLGAPVSDATEGWLTPHILEGREVREHYFDARERFPGEPRLVLAWGVAEEAAAHSWLYTWGALRRESRRLSDSLPSAHLRNAATAFENVRSRASPALSREATLRLGSVRSYQGRTDEALSLWHTIVSDPAAQGDERFLAELLTARALIRLERPLDAETALRTALDLHPHAQSAAIHLAALRFQQGDAIDATNLIHATITRGTPENDPWLSYFDQIGGTRPRTLKAVREGWR